jgi:hypothetical protein
MANAAQPSSTGTSTIADAPLIHAQRGMRRLETVCAIGKTDPFIADTPRFEAAEGGGRSIPGQADNPTFCIRNFRYHEMQDSLAGRVTSAAEP